MDLGLITHEMEPFCKLFAQYMGDDPRFSSERVLRCLLSRKLSGQTNKRQKNFFKRFCKKLMDLHQYSFLLDFLRGTLLLREEYDLKRIYDLIADIPVREGYSLAQLCVDYAREVQAGEEFFDQIPEDADLFHVFPEDLELIQGGYEVRCALVRTLMRYVYQLDYDGEELTPAHIDALVDYVRREAQAEHEAECRYRAEHNAEMDALMAEKNHPFTRLPLPELTVFERDRAIPGLLVPFLEASRLSGEDALCYYIQQQYALPALAETPWEQSGNEFLPFMAEAAYYYADYLLAVFYVRFPFTNYKASVDPTYLSREFYYEAIGKTGLSRCRYTGPDILRYSREHCRLFSLWARVLDRSGKWLKDALNPRTYAFFVLQVPYMLFFGGLQEQAAFFLLRHYGQMDGIERSMPQCPLLLVRSILATTHCDLANALYGLFSYELTRVEQSKTLPESDHQRVLALSRQMLDFMDKARAYILYANEYTLDDRRSWFDILFGDGRRDDFLQACRKKVEEGELLPLIAFRELYNQVRAFSHPTGVVLPWLGLPRYDNYDKLPGALSRQLSRQGLGFWEQEDEAVAYYVRLAQLESLRDMDLHLQNHLFKLQRAELAANLDRVRALKQALPEDATEQEREALLADISAIAHDMAALAMGSSMRPEAERKITALRKDFEETYLEGQVDLLRKLPEKIRTDVHNYLVTSTMVFQMMEARDDDTLDYSAALISMTKALELVMVYVYSRLHVQPYEKMDAKTESIYFKDGQPVKTQTLRPCIESLNGKRFEAWGGDAVMDMSMLHRFGDIELVVGLDAQGEPVKDAFSPSRKRANANRDKLCRSLGYVCENYRNRSAHPDVVTLMQVKECQQLLIDGQKLLWIVLSTLKEE